MGQKKEWAEGMVGEDIWKSTSQTVLSPFSVMCSEQSCFCKCRTGYVALCTYSSLYRNTWLLAEGKKIHNRLDRCVLLWKERRYANVYDVIREVFLLLYKRVDRGCRYRQNNLFQIDVAFSQEWVLSRYNNWCFSWMKHAFLQ